MEIEILIIPYCPMAISAFFIDNGINKSPSRVYRCDPVAM